MQTPKDNIVTPPKGREYHIRFLEKTLLWYDAKIEEYAQTNSTKELIYLGLKVKFTEILVYLRSLEPQTAPAPVDPVSTPPHTTHAYPAQRKYTSSLEARRIDRHLIEIIQEIGTPEGVSIGDFRKHLPPPYHQMSYARLTNMLSRLCAKGGITRYSRGAYGLVKPCLEVRK